MEVSHSVLCDPSESHDNFNILFADKEEVFEYEQNDSPPTLKGRLKAHLSFWESINANSFILHLIQLSHSICQYAH